MSLDKLKRKATKKSGRRFEELIAWIQRSVHKNAIITANERIKDIDTGKPRQVDITIRLSDGPTEFLGIVEVRDRNRPIGVRYVEEISGKLRSVRADAAFLVSKSGFTETAIAKAKQLCIRVLTYEEAKTDDWSNWLECRTFGILQLKYDNPVVTPFEYGTNKLITPSSKTVEILKNELNAKIITDEQGKPILSLPDMVKLILNHFGKELKKDVPLDGAHVNKRLLFKGRFEPALWLETDRGIKVQIGNVGIELDLYNDWKEFPLKLMRYRTPDSNKSIAELATSDVEILGKKYRIEIIAPGAGKNIPAGTTVEIRTIKLDDNLE